MSKKSISLDPLHPPLYPLVNVLKTMAEEEFRPFSDTDIHNFEGQLNEVMGTKDYFISTIDSSNKKFSDKIYRPADLKNGWMDTPAVIIDTRGVIDLTGVPAFCFDLSMIEASKVIYTIDKILGIEIQLTISLEKGGSRKALVISESDKSLVRFASKLLGDYQMQKDLIARDLKYKSALLQNLLTHPKLEKVDTGEIPFPSPVFSFTIPEIDPTRFLEEIKNGGYEIGLVNDHRGSSHYTVANFINHSKEQIERFVDVTGQALAGVLS